MTDSKYSSRRYERSENCSNSSKRSNRFTGWGELERHAHSSAHDWNDWNGWNRYYL
jgi:hypothetical protein